MAVVLPEVDRQTTKVGWCESLLFEGHKLMLLHGG